MSRREGGGFGAPKPLPGQAGYAASKETKSTRLERETLQMEDKLRALRDQMAQEQQKRDSVSKVGGSRWRSARTDRGSVKSYAKDVREGRVKVTRPKKEPSKKGEPLRSGSAPSKSSPGRRGGGSRGGDYQSKSVSTWEVADTVGWLEHLGLGRYAETFRANELSGPVLLEVGLEDLDFMEIRMPAHRKLVLKGIESLKRHGRFVPLKQTGGASVLAAGAGPLRPPSASSSAGGGGDDGGGGDGVAGAAGGEARAARPAAEAKRVHWSQAKPLSENEVMGNGQLPVNLADGAYDEAAAQQAFRDAVNEWRGAGAGGGGPVRIVKEADIYGSGAAAAAAPKAAGGTQTVGGLFSAMGADQGDGGGGMWTNPFADGDGTGEAKGGGGGGGGLPPPDPEGGKLLRGAPLDEAREHEAFAAAVSSWRAGKPRGEALAEELGQRMEAERRARAGEVARAREALRSAQARRAAAAREGAREQGAGRLGEGRVEEPPTPGKPPAAAAGEGEVKYVDPAELLGRGEGEAARRPESPALSEASGFEEGAEEEEAAGGVSISLVQSTMLGAGGGREEAKGGGEGEEGYYVVEEDNEDEEEGK